MLDYAPGTIEALGLYLVRTSALVLSSPLLGLGTSFAGVKVALIAGLSLLFFSVSGEPLPDVGPIEFGMMALREVLIGVFLGFLLQLFMLSVRVAGQIVGQEMGFAMASQVDPSSGINTPLVTRIYENFFLMALLLWGGHHWILRALAASFTRAPVGDIHIASGLSEAFVTLFRQMFAAGLTFAAPIMAVMMLVSLLLGLLTRTVPNLNVMEVGFSIRISAAQLAMFLFAPMLAPIMERMAVDLFGWMDTALEAAGM